MNKSIRNTVLLIGVLLLITGGLFAQTELRLDTWVSGNIREENSYWYTIRATQSDRLVVETSGNTDTFLRAYNASYDLIGEDDDSGAGLNARLELFVQQGLTYNIVVSGLNSGPYQIRASYSTIQATELRLDTDVSADMREGENYWYRFRATQNGNLIVETNGVLDTYLEVYDESYNLLDSDDDSGNGLNARLNINAVAGQSYLIKERAFNNEISGPYRIWASFRGFAPPIARGTQIIELRIGTSVSGYLGGGDEYVYSVRSSQAGFVTVETTGNIDTYLEVYDTSYNLFSQNDDGGEGNNARIEIIASAGATYLFKLKGKNSRISGPYLISASIAPPTPTELRLNTMVSGNLREGDVYWYSIRATESGYITVGTTGSTDTYLEAFDSSYRLLGQDDDSGNGNNARLRIQVQEGQTYIFRLRGYSTSTIGPYSIRASF
jgi:hypothetical protein